MRVQAGPVVATQRLTTRLWQACYRGVRQHNVCLCQSLDRGARGFGPWGPQLPTARWLQRRPSSRPSTRRSHLAPIVPTPLQQTSLALLPPNIISLASRSLPTQIKISGASPANSPGRRRATASLASGSTLHPLSPRTVSILDHPGSASAAAAGLSITGSGLGSSLRPATTSGGGAAVLLSGTSSFRTMGGAMEEAAAGIQRLVSPTDAAGMGEERRGTGKWVMGEEERLDHGWHSL